MSAATHTVQQPNPTQPNLPPPPGLTQGTATSIGALLRAAGPLATGALFSATAAARSPFLAFALLAFCYFVCLLVALSLPRAMVEAPRKPGALKLHLQSTGA